MLLRTCALLVLSLATLHCQPTVLGGNDGDGESEESAAEEESEESYVHPGDPCTEEGEEAACDAEFDTGVTVCERYDEELFWGDCACFSEACEDTPLVFSFDGAPVRFVTDPADFMLNPTMCIGTDWVSAATPWLALDRNGDGSINDGSELFGSATVLSSGSTARNGFVALAELDVDRDRRIAGSELQGLVLWSDVDADRVSSRVELSPLADRGILEIALDPTVERRCDTRGNCEGERAAFRYAEGGLERTGVVVDVYLGHR